MASAAYRPPTLINLWFLVSSALVFWDSGYMLLRPRSMRGGDLFRFWAPYELYGSVDFVYGIKHFQDREGFGPAQCESPPASRIKRWANLAHNARPPTQPSSTCLRTGAISRTCGSCTTRTPSRSWSGTLGSSLCFRRLCSNVDTCISAVATFWKTVLYWLMDQQCGWCQTYVSFASWG